MFDYYYQNSQTWTTVPSLTHLQSVRSSYALPNRQTAVGRERQAPRGSECTTHEIAEKDRWLMRIRQYALDVLEFFQKRFYVSPSNQSSQNFRFINSRSLRCLHSYLIRRSQCLVEYDPCQSSLRVIDRTHDQFHVLRQCRISHQIEKAANHIIIH